MVEDVSNKTIVVLVILTVIISILGTVVVLNEVGNMKIGSSPRVVSSGSASSGQVTLTIKESQPHMNAAGFVTFGLLPS